MIATNPKTIRKKCVMGIFSVLLAAQIAGTLIPPSHRPRALAQVLGKFEKLFHFAGNIRFFIPKRHEDVMGSFVIEVRKTIKNKTKVSILDNEPSFFGRRRLRELDWHTRYEQKVKWLGQPYDAEGTTRNLEFDPDAFASEISSDWRKWSASVDQYLFDRDEP